MAWWGGCPLAPSELASLPDDVHQTGAIPAAACPGMPGAGRWFRAQMTKTPGRSPQDRRAPRQRLAERQVSAHQAAEGRRSRRRPQISVLRADLAIQGRGGAVRRAGIRHRAGRRRRINGRSERAGHRVLDIRARPGTSRCASCSSHSWPRRVRWPWRRCWWSSPVPAPGLRAQRWPSGSSRVKQRSFWSCSRSAPVRRPTTTTIQQWSTASRSHSASPCW